MSLMKNEGTIGLRLGRLLTAFLTAVVVLIPNTAFASQDLATVTFNGAGWGHGIGMTQFGALGMAREGKPYDEILRYFYQGSSVSTLGEGGVPAPANIFVNLEPGNGYSARPQEISLIAMDLITSQTPDGTVPVDFVVARGEENWLVAVDGSIKVTRNSANVCDLVIKDAGGNVTTSDTGGGCGFLLTWDGFEAIPTRKVGIPGCSLTDYTTGSLEPCEYARGQLHIEEAVTGLNLVLEINIDDYVLGISEMPYFWGDEGQGGLEALKVQAVAARSWAFERALSIDPTAQACDCQLYDEPVSQRYVGWGHQGSITSWIAAVEATKSQVVTHPEAPTFTVVPAFYSSSSGGATEDKEDVWGGTRLPYLVSVPDPWSLDDQINYKSKASWSESWSGAGALSILQVNAVNDFAGWDTLTSMVVSQINTSGSASRVLATGLKDGVVVTDEVNASWIKKIFGLNSVYFRVNEPYGGAADPPVFDDTDGSVHETNIEWAAAQGITLGCNPPSNTSFCPDQIVTRGQMAAFLKRALDLPAATTDYFTDDNGSIFEGDINALASAGITSGCDGGSSFCPDDAVTRGEMAAFLKRAFGLATSSVDYFTDDDDSMFEQDINGLRLAEITLGCNPPTNDNFCPDDPVTRGQMATFLHRAVDG